MRPKVPFLTTTYGAYHQREVPGEDAELTHVGPGTPAGEYLRRFWQPVAHVEDLKDLPIAIRIMGEDLVVFRDNRGRIGLLQRHCSHRGTSLEYGVVEEKGIRCCYHGWLYDVDGTILETPAEPPDSTYKERLCHGAYPVHEYCGLVFAYMGPAGGYLALPDLRYVRVAAIRTRLGAARGRGERQALQLAPDHGQRRGPRTRAVPSCAQQWIPVSRRRRKTR